MSSDMDVADPLQGDGAPGMRDPDVVVIWQLFIALACLVGLWALTPNPIKYIIALETTGEETSASSAATVDSRISGNTENG